MPCSRITNYLLLALAIPLAIAWPGRSAAEGAPPALAPQESQKQEAARLREMLPGVEAFSPEGLREGFTRLEMTPHERPDLRFEMLAPKGWDSQVAELEPGQMERDAEQAVPLAELFSTDQDTSLVVYFTRPPRDLTPRQYLDQIVAERKWTLLGRQSAEIHGLKAELALTRNENPDYGPILRRVTILRHGAFLFMIAGAAVEPAYEKYKKQLGVSVTSLRPLGM